jgi:hypothetical protein
MVSLFSQSSHGRHRGQNHRQSTARLRDGQLRPDALYQHLPRFLGRRRGHDYGPLHCGRNGGEFWPCHFNQT